MGVTLQVRKHADNIAKTIQALQDALADRGRLWVIADDADDETYENRVNVTALSEADDAIEAAAQLFASATVKKSITLLVDYARADLALASPYIDTYLATVGGFRVPYEYAEAHYSACGGTRLLYRNVFPKGTLVANAATPATAGMHKFGSLTGTSGASTYASVDGALPSSVTVSPIVCISRDATPGSPPTLAFTRLDTTTAEIAVTPSATQYGQVIVGQQAITNVAGCTFSCAATAQFKVGEYVLLYENADGDTSQREVAKVKTVGDTSIVVEFDESTKTEPVHTFTSSGFILPMFTEIDSFVSGNITNSKHLDFYALPDRIIAF